MPFDSSLCLPLEFRFVTSSGGGRVGRSHGSSSSSTSSAGCRRLGLCGRFARCGRGCLVSFGGSWVGCALGRRTRFVPVSRLLGFRVAWLCRYDGGTGGRIAFPCRRCRRRLPIYHRRHPIGLSLVDIGGPRKHDHSGTLSAATNKLGDCLGNIREEGGEDGGGVRLNMKSSENADDTETVPSTPNWYFVEQALSTEIASIICSIKDNSLRMVGSKDFPHSCFLVDWAGWGRLGDAHSLIHSLTLAETGAKAARQISHFEVRKQQE